MKRTLALVGTLVLFGLAPPAAAASSETEEAGVRTIRVTGSDAVGGTFQAQDTRKPRAVVSAFGAPPLGSSAACKLGYCMSERTRVMHLTMLHFACRLNVSLIPPSVPAPTPPPDCGMYAGLLEDAQAELEACEQMAEALCAGGKEMASTDGDYKETDGERRVN